MEERKRSISLSPSLSEVAMRSLALLGSEPPPPLLQTLDASASATTSSNSSTVAPSSPPSSSSFSYSLSLLTIALIISFVVIVSASIHFLLRLLSSRFSSQHSFDRSRSSASLAASESTSESSPSRPSEKEREALIMALPLVTLAESPGDCAVCLSRFRAHDPLRLLPACRHAFHAACVDVWLRSTPSCPLCRSSIDTPPPPPPPPPPAATEAARRPGSFRVEIGSVSRRQTGDEPLPHGQSYSLGSAFQYLIEDEVEAVVARALQRPSAPKERKPEDGAQPPPGAEVAESVGDRGGSWLRDYVDRLASSASSSFSSLRFSSRHFDGTAADEGCGDGRDLEANHHRTASAAGERDDGGHSTFYWWLIGVSS